eukprot:765364-Hanusia_phi.AAC.2
MLVHICWYKGVSKSVVKNLLRNLPQPSQIRQILRRALLRGRCVGRLGSPKKSPVAPVPGNSIARDA